MIKNDDRYWFRIDGHSGRQDQIFQRPVASWPQHTSIPDETSQTSACRIGKMMENGVMLLGKHYHQIKEFPLKPIKRKKCQIMWRMRHRSRFKQPEGMEDIYKLKKRIWYLLDWKKNSWISHDICHSLSSTKEHGRHRRPGVQMALSMCMVMEASLTYAADN